MHQGRARAHQAAGYETPPEGPLGRSVVAVDPQVIELEGHAIPLLKGRPFESGRGLQNQRVAVVRRSGAVLVRSPGLEPGLWSGQRPQLWPHGARSGRQKHVDTCFNRGPTVLAALY